MSPAKVKELAQVDPDYLTMMANVVTAAQLYVHRGPRSAGTWERLFDSVTDLDEFENQPDEPGEE